MTPDRRPASIVINTGLCIPSGELRFRFSRSGGPGGQNVNKVNTRVTLQFDVNASPSLSADQRRRILARLSTRITRHGVLQITSMRHRTQAGNRGATLERFSELVGEALRPRARRVPTKIPAGTRRRRLEDKRFRGLSKNLRRRVDGRTHET